MLTAAFLLYDARFNPPLTTASYAAAMAKTGQPADVRFMILAYAKTEHQPSKLVLQWSERHSRSIERPLHLWAEHAETKNLTYIGPEASSGTPWNLKKSQWAHLTESGRLLVTRDNQAPGAGNVLFEGRCLQLRPWKRS